MAELSDQQQRDIASAVVRIEQLAGLLGQIVSEDGLADLVLHRLVTCDCRRLRAMLGPTMLKMMDEVMTGGGEEPVGTPAP